ncbi:hypothetical protein LUZ63_010383 [Rhynchospora breviuscula]|uniref:Cytochrome P450 n=1 Tax=Rhynchospora breviuscula TaxID=2022672 RepID=A0A9Q0CGZ9_9POAL|nr:hypothetical protein LUZ63_010383 [Rhynchospora breviuscula]
MDNTVQSWWVFPLALSPKIFDTLDTTLSLSSIATVFFSFASAVIITWLVTSLLYWTHQGGPAWGRYWRRTNPSSYSAIPGPRGLPFIGSMRIKSGLSHLMLDALAKQLGAKRLMAFSLGETRAIVSSHPAVAKEILNSPDFADRPVNHSAYGLMFHRSIGFAPYGVYWRTLRKIASYHLFCPSQIEVSACHRASIATQMTSYVRSTAPGKTIQVRGVLRRAALYYIMQSVFGKQYNLSSNDAEVEQLLWMVDEGYELLGMSNWSDYFPLLAGLDLQRIQSRSANLMPKVNQLVNSIIEEHRSNSGSRKERDFVDILLSLQESEELSDSDVAAVLWEMIFRGTEAMAVQMEWTLARIVLHPEVQAKIHAELDQVVGGPKAVTESDSVSLVYLQAVIKEVLRMHPPGPLLAWARESITDTFVDGRFVPAGTTAMINMWAITHDPDVWQNPDEFTPERFIADNYDTKSVNFSVMGTDLRLAPFGAGRRSCPGKGMAVAAVGFWIASLLHEFELLPVEGKAVDLSELMKLSCEMKVPLEVAVRPRRDL